MKRADRELTPSPPASWCRYLSKLVVICGKCEPAPDSLVKGMSGPAVI